MKKTLLLSAMAIMSCFVTAQKDSTKYLFEDMKISSGGFGGPVMQFSHINDEFAYYFGGGGGVIFNQRLFIGGYGLGLSTEHNWAISEGVFDSRDKLSFRHGGGWIGYNFLPEKPVHFSTSLKIGSGSYERELFIAGEYVETEDFEVLVLSPDLGVELNFFSWFKLGINLGYQYVHNPNNQLNSSRLNAFTGNLALKFGYFGE